MKNLAVALRTAEAKPARRTRTANPDPEKARDPIVIGFAHCEFCGANRPGDFPEARLSTHYTLHICRGY